ncbi:MAG: hypothetical protein ACTSPY_10305 [Candidatus Helarchaeota archaeon]
MKKQQITFISTQLGVTDYFSWNEDDTFADLIMTLKNKYKNNVLKYLQKNFNNIRENISLDDVTIKLHYFDREGNILTIGNFAKVNEIVSKRVNRVYWSPEPIGGVLYFSKNIC